jgi:DNA-directed RNA polymerase specialized sigma24 family protein
LEARKGAPARACAGVRGGPSQGDRSRAAKPAPPAAGTGAWLAGFEAENWFQVPLLEPVSVEAELRRIPPEYAEVVLLKIWGELTFEQIANTLDINPSTAASRYRYGLRDLRDVLGKGKTFAEHKTS